MALDVRDELIARPRRSAAATSVAGGVDTPPLAVVVAMKPQLRGRIRRNVETLLELGMRVVVVTVDTPKDFYVGLASPRLTGEFLTVRTWYARFVTWRRRDTARRQRTAAARLDRARRKHLRRALRLRRSPRAMVNALLAQPRFRIAADATVTPFPSWVIWALVLVLVPTTLVAAVVYGLLAAAGAGLRALGVPAMPSTVGRAPERLARAALRRVRPVARFVRRRVWQPCADGAARARESVLDGVGERLRRVSRVESFFRFWAGSEAVVRRLAPDVVVSSDLPGLVGASRAARSLGIRQVHDCHELYLESTSFKRWEQRLLAPIERRHMRRTAAVVAVNRSIAEEYDQRYGILPRVVRNCASPPSADSPERDIRDLAGIPAGTRVVLYQGGFGVGRGLDVALAAMRDVPSDIHLVMLGYGPLEAHLRSTAAELGLGDRVHIVPAVPPEELLSYTASADAGLIPYQPVSKNNYYSLPNKCFEYTSVGVPLIVSDLPELRRVAVDGGCGVTYDSYDPASLSVAISKVMHPSMHQTFRLGAEAFGAANSWEREREVLVGAFSEALAPAVRGRVGAAVRALSPRLAAEP